MAYAAAATGSIQLSNTNKPSPTQRSSRRKPKNPPVSDWRIFNVERCPRCGEAMVETYCKSLCPNCGYMRDCNDQW